MLPSRQVEDQLRSPECLNISPLRYSKSPVKARKKEQGTSPKGVSTMGEGCSFYHSVLDTRQPEGKKDKQGSARRVCYCAGVGGSDFPDVPRRSIG